MGVPIVGSGPVMTVVVPWPVKVRVKGSRDSGVRDIEEDRSVVEAVSVGIGPVRVSVTMEKAVLEPLPDTQERVKGSAVGVPDAMMLMDVTKTVTEGWYADESSDEGDGMGTNDRTVVVLHSVVGVPDMVVMKLEKSATGVWLGGIEAVDVRAEDVVIGVVRSPSDRLAIAPEPLGVVGAGNTGVGVVSG